MQRCYNFPNYKNFGEEKLSPSVVKRPIVDCSTNNGKSVVKQVFLSKNLTALVNLIQDFKFRIAIAVIFKRIADCFPRTDTKV